MTLAHRLFRSFIAKAVLLSLTGLGELGAARDADAATATAAASAVVVAPVGIAAPGAFTWVATAGGSLAANGSGARADSGTTGSGASSPWLGATVDIKGDGTSNYSVSYGNATVLSGPTVSGVTQTLELAAMTENQSGGTIVSDAGSGTLTASSRSVQIGGALALRAAHAAGTYSGAVKVTVEYN